MLNSTLENPWEPNRPTIYTRLHRMILPVYRKLWIHLISSTMHGYSSNILPKNSPEKTWLLNLLMKFLTQKIFSTDFHNDRSLKWLDCDSADSRASIDKGHLLFPCCQFNNAILIQTKLQLFSWNKAWVGKMTHSPSVNKWTSTFLSWNSRLHCINWIHYQPSWEFCLSL